MVQPGDPIPEADEFALDNDPDFSNPNYTIHSLEECLPPDLTGGATAESTGSGSTTVVLPTTTSEGADTTVGLDSTGGSTTGEEIEGPALRHPVADLTIPATWAFTMVEPGYVAPEGAALSDYEFCYGMTEMEALDCNNVLPAIDATYGAITELTPNTGYFVGASAIFMGGMRSPVGPIVNFFADDSLLSRYRMEEGVAVDEVGGNDGVVSGATFGEGVVGEGAVFDGVDDSISVLNTSAFDFSGDFAVGGWVLTNGSVGFQAVLDRRSPPNAGTVFEIYFTPGQILTLGATGCSLSAGEAAELGAWTHFAVSRAGDEMSLWMNGELVDSVAGCVTNFNVGASTYFGSLSDGMGEPLNGGLDEMWTLTHANAAVVRNDYCVGAASSAFFVGGNFPESCLAL